MAHYSEEQLDAHQAMLEERVFHVHTQWPHFAQLLREVRRWSRELPEGGTVVSLERGLLYGGISLVAPFFHRQRFVSVDCSPASADARGAYNASLVDDPRTLRVPTTRRAPIEATGLEVASADLVLVPNLVHHVADQHALFGEMARITRSGGRVYVFEPLVRELHQIPDDYLRYTPFGMQQVMRECGLEPEGYATEGGPFSVIAYAWVQALQYLPEDRREKTERWFREEHFPELMRWDEEFTTNLVRKHTSFPMSFSVVARKP
jgi:SAM-dependent methyltransferase